VNVIESRNGSLAGFIDALCTFWSAWRICLSDASDFAPCVSLSFGFIFERGFGLGLDCVRFLEMCGLLAMNTVSE